MFQKVDGLNEVEAALYVFHDPPTEGQHLMRATTAAYLTCTGELFIGCSCASEGDQFTRREGRELATQEAFDKLKRWTRKGKQSPDTIVSVEFDLIQPDEDELAPRKWYNVNKKVKDECLLFQLERFRLLLAKRFCIIQELNAELDQITEMWCAHTQHEHCEE